MLRRPTHGLLVCCTAFLLIGLSGGCVKRSLLIRSQPEGALVTIDSQTLGNTPLNVPFTYYGTREIQLEKDGYQTLKAKQRIRPPWWQWPPLDFFTDNFAFRELHDRRVLDFQMEPLKAVDENQLIDRADTLRGQAQQQTVPMPLGRRDSTGESRR